ncbi:hypothetical protein TNCV_2784241 [Trichonephila clavipes]|nr:hypothetical protein TNCV_2784241 [Trichonephila clavipes]
MGSIFLDQVERAFKLKKCAKRIKTQGKFLESKPLVGADFEKLPICGVLLRSVPQSSNPLQKTPCRVQRKIRHGVDDSCTLLGEVADTESQEFDHNPLQDILKVVLDGQRAHNDHQN